jgi:phosphoglucan,water dikinase
MFFSNPSRQVMRQIQPWLPSFSSEFTCSVPLTRIRDIAHRNDIPQAGLPRLN